MKQNLFFIIAIFAVLAVTGCDTHKKAAPQTNRAPVKRDFATLGRDLSQGSVDLYDPGASVLTMPSESLARSATPVSPIAKSQSVLVNDPSVTIYSLDTMDISEPAPAPLPPLQPPNVQKSYPSPFNQNGNFDK